MPTPSTYQPLGMKTFGGLSPGLNANGFIEDIAYMVKVVAKTAAYTVSLYDSGTIFTTRGATAAVTFTLPAAASADGCIYYFFSAVDFAMTVASAEGDNIITFNDAAADNVAMSTTSEILGAAVMIVGDGTGWLAFLMVNETQTPVIGT